MEKVLKSKYKIIEPIQEGEFSSTYKGQVLSDGSPALIETFKRSYLDSQLIRTLQEKVAALQPLSDPHIVRLIDGDYGWQGFYFIKEYFAGTTLKALQRAKPRFEIDQVVSFAKQIAAALAAAHHRQIAHGYLRPEFIWVAGDQLKVSDFALANTFENPQQSRRLLNDATYLSPEEISGTICQPAGDCYSLGIILYALLAGMPPFKGKHQLEVALKHLRDQPVPLSRIRPEVPQYLEEIIFKALAKDPLARFPDGEAFLKSLEAKGLPPQLDNLDVNMFRYQAEDEELKPPLMKTVPEDEKRGMVGVTRKISLGEQLVSWSLTFLTVILLSGLLFAIIQLVIFK